MKITALQEFVPLHVETATWNDPTLFIKGSNWNFYCVTPWRIVDKSKLICGCYDNEASLMLTQLQQDIIIAITPQSPRLILDLVFEFSKGLYLEIFSGTYYEPLLHPMGLLMWLHHLIPLRWILLSSNILDHKKDI